MRNPYSTRVFLSAAAIGAAGGVLAIALNWIFIAINTTPLATLAIVAVFGVWVLPGMLSQLLFRAPGIALFTMIVRRRALRVPARSRRPRPPGTDEP